MGCVLHFPHGNCCRGYDFDRLIGLYFRPDYHFDSAARGGLEALPDRAGLMVDDRAGNIAVECRDVRKEFTGRHSLLALSDINLTLREGEFAAVLGPSGCGKS